MQDNYEISKQILKDVLEVKLEYEGVIKQALLMKPISNQMKKIIKENKKEIKSQPPKIPLEKKPVEV